ncbi:putative tetratricopeptide-like helical domain superfamily, DYW domain-containing protein [Helianthus annuus]|nr:putative tetratricopeptide-like helical domain superfamily, DYW domain-containing protein [Helianthus annuus]
MLSSTLRPCSIVNFTASTHIIKCHSTFLHNQTHPPTSFHALCRGYHSNSLLESVITSITLCSSIPVCRLIHSRVIKCLNYNDCFIGDRLVSLYARLGFLYDAHHLFDEMPNRDLVSWNSFISVFSQMGEVGCGIVEGGYVHGFAVKSGLLSERKVVNSLINMYGKHGCLNVASMLFQTIKLPNLVSWNSMIKIHVQNSVLEKGVLYFNMMRRVEVYPDQATIVTILQCCADIGVGKVVDTFHGYILCSGLDKSIPTMTALLNVYAKSGRLTASCEIFKEMKEPDMIAWTAMLAAYAMHGYGRHAIDHFDFMVKKGFEPDHVTFTHLLSACSHSGLVNEGKQLFNEMSSVYKVKPRLDHYSCMVDLFGRSGHLKDARVLIDSMPMEPNGGVWGALLNGCKVYGDIKLGEEVAQKLISLNPSDPRNYIMLSSIYSKAGRWVDFSKVRALMKDQGVVKTAGSSFIEHDHKIHRFVVSDQAHPDIEPNTEFVLHDVEEDVKGDLVKSHSEKLAIAFGLLVYSDNVPIIITKNLRICGDCHNMAKFVSRVEKRVIIIRDTRRFHHFADGLCSCGDYW